MACSQGHLHAVKALLKAGDACLPALTLLLDFLSVACLVCLSMSLCVSQMMQHSAIVVKCNFYMPPSWPDIASGSAIPVLLQILESASAPDKFTFMVTVVKHLHAVSAGLCFWEQSEFIICLPTALLQGRGSRVDPPMLSSCYGLQHILSKLINGLQMPLLETGSAVPSDLYYPGFRFDESFIIVDWIMCDSLQPQPVHRTSKAGSRVVLAFTILLDLRSLPAWICREHDAACSCCGHIAVDLLRQELADCIQPCCACHMLCHDACFHIWPWLASGQGLIIAPFVPCCWHKSRSGRGLLLVKSRSWCVVVQGRAFTRRRMGRSMAT